MGKTNSKVLARLKRKFRVAKKRKLEADVPRLSVFRSNRHIYAQVISDLDGKTLFSTSTMSKNVVEVAKGKNDIAAAKKLAK